MSSWYQPETPPPPPAKSASLNQILAMLVFGGIGSYFVITAIRSRPGQSLAVGGILILCALIFFAGLISKNRVVELVASGILLIGSSLLVAITINSGQWIWALGAVFFLLCVAVIQLKHRFIDQSQPPSDERRNPYD